jgi:hypothetical protein
MKLGSASHTKGIQVPSRTYRVDGSRQFLVRAFLSGGLAPLRLDGDATTATAKVSGTYYIPEEGVSPIFPLTHADCSSSPSWSEITCVGRSPLAAVGGPVPAQGCFDWRSPTAGPTYW